MDLRWLAARGYVEIGPPKISFDVQTRLAVAQNSSPGYTTSQYILTKEGAVLASYILANMPPPCQIRSERNSKIEPPSWAADVLQMRFERKPNWDFRRKELRLGGCVIKQFRWSAANQEAILMAFEEDGWPPRIDDPLPPKLNQDSKRRLHDTIKCLNRSHKKRLIRFSGDGTGEGVLWGFLAVDDLRDERGLMDSSALP
jgi:hypothetical protein